MKIATRLLLAACLVLPFAACSKKETAAPTAADVSVALPTAADAASWKDYLTYVVEHNSGKITNPPFVYFLSGRAADPDFDGKYERQAGDIKNSIARGVPAGNMIVFAAPESAKMADIVVDAFKGAQPDTFKNVRVLFIGDAADKDRVTTAVAPSGADFVFVETK